MPLILMVGLPSSGKTKRAKSIEEYFLHEQKKKVHLISENDILRSKEIDKNILYFDSKKEKEIRDILKSETIRVLNEDNVVILDACNYIKGYRYELYCAGKNGGSTQVLVETIAPQEECWAWNQDRAEEERYTEPVFQALHQRYETPDSRNRWDSPLFCLEGHQETPGQYMFEALFLRRPPPPNQSTQTTPLSSADVLYELDQVTQAIVQEVLSALRGGGGSGRVRVRPGTGEELWVEYGSATPGGLARLRRQFVTFTKLHPPNGAQSSADMARLFVHYLNTSLGGLR